MKFFLSGSTILLLIIFSSLEGGLSSCTKDKTIFDTVIVTKKDTLIKVDTLKVHDTTVLKDTFLTAQMLTAHPWILLEARGVQAGAILYYLRGGASNTQSFDNEYLTFNADHTGLLIDNAFGSHAMTTWDFGNPEHTKLVFTLVNYGSVTSVYTYDNIRYIDGNLHYDDYFTDNLTNQNYHGQEIRIPKTN